MAILRVNKTKDYTIISNFHLKDSRLSLKAKGLLSIMLSLSEEWQYSIAGLVAISKENETAIKSTLTELKKCGYLVVTKKKPNETASGRYEYVYDIYEHPRQEQDIEKQDIEKQGVENLGVEFLGVENQGQYNINKLNTNKSNINNISSSINTTTNKEKENKKEKENSTNLEIKGGVKAEIVRPEVLEIYNYWQSKKILNHKSLNDTLQKAIKKALKEYDVDTIKQSIDRYHTILLDKDYFFCYHWGLDKFLTQKNTLPEFLENGAKWVAYQATKNSSQPSKEKQNVSSIIDELLAESLGKEIEL